MALISKTECKKQLRSIGVDLADGESFAEWFKIYWQLAKEDGLITKKGNREYIDF